MAVKISRADGNRVDKIASLFDAYRQFYEQPANLPESRDFIAQRLTLNESAIFYAQDEHGETLGFVQLYPVFSSLSAHRTWLLSDPFATEVASVQA